MPKGGRPTFRTCLATGTSEGGRTKKFGWRSLLVAMDSPQCGDWHGIGSTDRPTPYSIGGLWVTQGHIWSQPGAYWCSHAFNPIDCKLTSFGFALSVWGILCRFPLKWTVIDQKCWIPTNYFSNATFSSVTNLRFSSSNRLDERWQWTNHFCGLYVITNDE